MNQSAQQIHLALQTVAHLRAQRADDIHLANASNRIKRFQAARFQATYQDLLQTQRYRTATHFFLNELYGEKDYAERDQQFARIATTIAKLFPQAVVDTAAALATVHALTEQLDNDMARQWLLLEQQNAGASTASRYIECWRKVGDGAARQQQLQVVLALGSSLNELTRKTGLRTLLKMMRGPAAAAGLGSLQKFLETGFDAFAAMRGADEFLALIRERETEWIEALFSGDAAACEMKLALLLQDSALQ